MPASMLVAQANPFLVHHVVIISLQSSRLSHPPDAIGHGVGVQLMPVISSLTPLTTIIPLVAVLMGTAVKDGADDLVSSRSTTIVALATFLLSFTV